MLARVAFVVVLLVGSAVAGEPEALDEPPPWAAAAPLATAAVPKVYLDEHRKAENRATCPLLVITDPGSEGKGARARRASFHGGWAVAYDKKGKRSLFGVAGAGVEKGGGPQWPREIHWKDGSKAGYGPEGGTGPNALAFVEAADAGCLYNVWSAVSEQHLLTIIQGLRRVQP